MPGRTMNFWFMMDTVSPGCRFAWLVRMPLTNTPIRLSSACTLQRRLRQVRTQCFPEMTGLFSRISAFLSVPMVKDALSPTGQRAYLA